MMYDLGRRLQGTDFTDEGAGRAIAQDLRENLSLTPGNCILRLLHSHSKHEEKDFFRPLRPVDPDVVKLMMKEHAEVGRRVRQVSRTCDELLAESTSARRIETGDRLNLEANDLFAYCLQHMNNEEATMVPVMGNISPTKNSEPCADSSTRTFLGDDSRRGCGGPSPRSIRTSSSSSFAA